MTKKHDPHESVRHALETLRTEIVARRESAPLSPQIVDDALAATIDKLTPADEKDNDEK